MATYLEQVLIKLGVDQSQVNPSLDSFKEKVHQAADHAHKSFLHAESGGRAFHKVIEKINEAIPGIGPAVTALINPMTALLAGLALGFEKAREALKKYNEELDEQGKINAEPIWGKKEIQEAKEEVRALREEYEKYKKSLRPDGVPETVKAIRDESDPKTKLSQARQVRDRLAAERDAKLRELDEVQKKREHLAERSTKIPGELAAAQRTRDLFEKEGPPEFITDPEGPAADPEMVAQANAEYDRRVSLARGRVQRLSSEQGANANSIREAKQRALDLQHGISERQSAINDLQGIIDPLAPLDSLPRGKKVGTNFRLTAPGFNAPPGMITVFDKMGAHLEKIASWGEGDHMRVLPTNGP